MKSGQRQGHPSDLPVSSGGFVASISAIVTAGMEMLHARLILTGLEVSCVHCASSWWANGLKANVLQSFTSAILARVILISLAHYLVALRDNIISRSDQVSWV